MNDATWERLIDAIDVRSGLSNHQKTTRPIEDHPELSEQVESFEFEREGERLKVERATGPAIVDRKTHYSHRPGVANRIETIYDVNEIAHRVTLYREQGGEWIPIDIHALDL